MTTKNERFTALCLDLIAGEREKCGIAADVRLSVAKCTCRWCGSIVAIPAEPGIRPAYCVDCGAAGEDRSIHPRGNEPTFTEPAPVQVSDVLGKTREAAALSAAYLPSEVSR